jgi:hypothetical protein
MKNASKKFLIAASLFSVLILVMWGCNGSRPLAPAQNVNLGISLAPSKDLQASLLGTTSNTLLWNYQINGEAGVHGQAGPFSSSIGAGNVNFSVNLPAGGKKIFSIQLNDANTGEDLAVGAALIDLTSPTVNMSVTIALGSVVRACYTLSNAGLDTDYDLVDHFVVNPYYAPIPADTEVVYGDTNYWLMDVNYNPTIAYLGNGNLVDYDYVPSDDVFNYLSGESKYEVLNPSSAKPTPVPTYTPPSARKGAKSSTGQNLDLATGDVYCIKLTNLPGAYAWVQITDPGNLNNSIGPSFCFRISTDPFYSYYQTNADLNQNCSWGNTSGSGYGGTSGGGGSGGGG